jgi:hypothetical protein
MQFTIVALFATLAAVGVAANPLEKRDSFANFFNGP